MGRRQPLLATMMNTISLVLVAGLLSFSAVAASQVSGETDCGFTPRSMFERTADFTRDPVPQIQAHLAQVIERLEKRDVSGLRPEVAERRLEQIAALADYSAAGVSPQNELLGLPSPIFIDAGGGACASVLPGDTWYFQAWYRDANPASTSNLSNVIWITFS